MNVKVSVTTRTGLNIQLKTLKHLLIVNSKFIIKLKIALNGANMIKTTGLFKNSDKFCIMSLSLSMNGRFSFIPL